MTESRGADLLRDVLPGVSRSFAPSLRLVPAPLRAPLGITYLLARAADTLADTRAVPPAERRERIEILRAAIRSGDRGDLPRVVAQAAPDRPAADRALLDQLPEVLALYRALSPGDRARAQTVLLTLMAAMLDALGRFPPETEGRIGAFETRADLDRYTYMNAGCVGEYWTDMVVAHRRLCQRWNVPLMRARGVRFGQAPPPVNVLRDLPRDLRNGRCYLPRADLTALSLEPADLLSPAAMPRLQPLVMTLIDRALADFEVARAYLLDIPRREVRLRLASALPLLIGLGTLGRLRRAENLLDPAVIVKIPRTEVRRHLAVTALLAPSNRGLSIYARRLAASAAAS